MLNIERALSVALNFGRYNPIFRRSCSNQIGIIAVAKLQSIDKARGTSPSPPKRAASPIRRHDLRGTELSRSSTGSHSAIQAAVLELQRTIGNRAVVALLDQRMASGPATKLTIQRLPLYKEFLSHAQSKSKLLTSDVFTTKAGEAARGINEDMSGQGSIPDAYKAWQKGRPPEKAQSLNLLINLYDVITFWETLNAVNASAAWFKPATEVLITVKERIKTDVATATDRASAGGAKKRKKHLPPPAEQDSPLRPTKSAPNERPDWMQTVGIPETYYNKYLKGDLVLFLKLSEFYTYLEAGELPLASAAYKQIENQPGMYLIRPMILAHFTGQAGLAGLVGTQSTGRGQLTDDEKTAIKLYSELEYSAMNLQLRTGQKGKADLTSAMQLVVSGMNKLPPYKGIAYRTFVTEPKHYFDVIQPGTLIVDLAFQSASPSLKGVEAFLSQQTGTKHIYCMIHSKSAVNIMDFASLKKEGEVLFRPGTKFRLEKVWEHKNGKVPPGAPAEAQMILHKQGEKKTGGVQDDKGNLLQKGIKTGLTEKDVMAGKFTEQEKQTMVWYKVKVLEMVEV